MSETNAVKDESERNEVERLQPVVMRWIPCTDWESLPDGDWLVKINKERKPYNIANVITNNGGNKIIIVGNCFHFDMGNIVAYTEFERYGA